MFITVFFTDTRPSGGTVHVCVVTHWKTAPCLTGKNTHLISASKVITACWKIKPDGLPCDRGRWEYQLKKFQVWENPLSCVREREKKKKTNCYPTDWFLGSVTLIHFCDMFFLAGFRFLLPQRFCLSSTVWRRLLLWPDWSGGPGRSLCCRILLPQRLFRGSRYALPPRTLLPFGDSSSSGLSTWNYEKSASLFFFCYRRALKLILFLGQVDNDLFIPSQKQQGYLWFQIALSAIIWFVA